MTINKTVELTVQSKITVFIIAIFVIENHIGFFGKNMLNFALVLRCFDVINL